MMQERYIDRFDVVILDMGNTFMFGADRFSDSEDYGATYRAAGGSALDDGLVKTIISTAYALLIADYRNPAFYDDFPTIDHYIRAVPESKGLSEAELRLLEHVFGLHERGRIPESHALALHELSRTHRLGLVSNIWAGSALFLQEFERAGVRDLFEVTVFSSDHRIIKPSPRLFAVAIDAIGAPRSRITYVGDNHKRDVGGARASGISVALIDGIAPKREPNVPEPDIVIGDLRDLLS